MMQLNFTYEHELMKETHKPLHISNMLWEKFAFSTFCQAFYHMVDTGKGFTEPKFGCFFLFFFPNLTTWIKVEKDENNKPALTLVNKYKLQSPG